MGVQFPFQDVSKQLAIAGLICHCSRAYSDHSSRATHTSSIKASDLPDGSILFFHSFLPGNSESKPDRASALTETGSS